MGALTVIQALAALAQAGGAYSSAYGAGQEANRSRAMQNKFHQDDLASQEQNRKLQMLSIGQNQEQIDNQAPGNALSFLSGLEDLKNKRAHSGSYLDTIRSLGNS